VKLHILFATLLVASVGSTIAAQAQGIPDGIAHGIYEGNRRAGPIGAVVGGAVGGVIGGIDGVFGIGPVYASAPDYSAYPEVRPRVYHHRRWTRHSYRHVRRRYSHG
jgi:hypothetical protein